MVKIAVRGWRVDAIIPTNDPGRNAATQFVRLTEAYAHSTIEPCSPLSQSAFLLFTFGMRWHDAALDAGQHPISKAVSCHRTP